MMTYFIVQLLTLTYILDENDFNDYLCKTFIKRKNSIWIDVGVSRVTFTYKTQVFQSFSRLNSSGTKIYKFLVHFFSNELSEIQNFNLLPTTCIYFCILRFFYISKYKTER